MNPIHESPRRRGMLVVILLALLNRAGCASYFRTGNYSDQDWERKIHEQEHQNQMWLRPGGEVHSE